LVIEGHFEGKRTRKDHQVGVVLARQCWINLEFGRCSLFPLWSG
jgi:hypothetical protein